MTVAGEGDMRLAFSLFFLFGFGPGGGGWWRKFYLCCLVLFLFLLAFCELGCWRL